MPGMPSTGVEVPPQAIESWPEIVHRQPRQAGDAAANIGIQISGRSAPVSRPEAVRAIVRHENGFDSIGANDLGDLLDGHFGGCRDARGGREVLLPEPKSAVDGWLIGEDDHSVSDADKFTQSRYRIRPVVNRQDPHRRIETVVEQR